ncbi:MULTISPECIES: alpha-ketoglutarate-dependent dioxygenase AlkB family protein [Acinetobacter]|uniref:alpha-ketoglutarate-dependent dioxygenase AlkB family protein n=1 Tax=Acinetobacter TaxID=469 RepID=UPI002577C1B8|nr:alpha-ketoglutarate-dependent dioxygenase AlkB [Acinetobacter indicus]MDM1771582.1 alpha-ketoglutarate-dependent dioxygenase AlkB [Acinetobacter indicus]MDM1774380.1 alpha-ketoglutarate-dependent dioxygenase AlkB [Acinetobacter indicus]
MNLELFPPEPRQNLLPYEGIVQDYGLILSVEDSHAYLQQCLQQLAWQADEVTLFGKHYVTARKIAWYGDEYYQYRYSGSLKQAQRWHPALWQLKQQIEQIVGHPFNSCLANLYADGSQGLGWHSDDEPSLVASPGAETVIASLSLGATRKFSFKHKHSAAKVELLLQSGQLIVMRGQTQRYWKHSLPKSSRVVTPRINLTFRYFYPL